MQKDYLKEDEKMKHQIIAPNICSVLICSYVQYFVHTWKKQCETMAAELQDYWYNGKEKMPMKYLLCAC